MAPMHVDEALAKEGSPCRDITNMEEGDKWSNRG